MKKFISIISILIFIFGSQAVAQLPDFCLSKEEYRLYSLINEYRVKNGVEVIPVSRSLCYVAKVHARDLYINNPDTSHCSLNSWSNQGNWSACCHSSLAPSPVCIANKPKELAKYPGEGHEIAYWDSEGLIPDTVLSVWKSLPQTRDLMLNTKKWSYFKWKAIGIGMYKGYACVWVSDAADTQPEPTLCSTPIMDDNFPMPFKINETKVITQPTERYYLIFGSFNTKDDAEKTAEKYRKDGFSNAKVLINDQKTFRVSLNDFATQKEALDTKSKLGNGYKDAWITKY